MKRKRGLGLMAMALGGTVGCSSGHTGSPPGAPSNPGDFPPSNALSPPAQGTATDSLLEGPTFTPFTVRPDIANRQDVARALEREYPRELRDAGIGGTVRMWFFIDAEGVVGRIRIGESSGHPGLDAAARRVARRIRFTPAYNKGERVPVWISFPITFTARRSP